ncbi:AAA family ATPase [Xenorhabdus sp. Sc-CR9]|nr:AAA family ATPase [Xenorhabdus sp. Sc-CR9]
METHKEINDFNTLNKEIDYLVRKRQDLDTQYRDLDNSLKIRESTLESPKLQEKVAELSMLTTILRGEKRKSTIIKNESIKIKQSDINLDKNNRVDYINYLIQSFSSDGGRNFTFDEMTNLVINMSQSFMTILAGPPGTGKTSTAIRLAKHSGLLDDDLTFSGSNFLNVAVGRAWVSGRDILGFYNSLKDLYQPSRTGLYEFLKSNENNEYLKLVLLDEANLSSIEHYWSDFLGMCDPEGANRKIDTGIPTTTERFFSISKNLRFLATINNDSTTEKLSPRLIDRVPIITMEHNFNYKSLPSQILDFNGAINFEKLNSAFNISASEASFTQDEENALDSILDILSSPIARTTSIKVSQRKINAMKRYCHIANEIENMHAAPLDYAINQHVIPLIEGYGSSFKERLIDLEQKLSECNLMISKSSINNIINHGDIYGDSYSFF